MNVIFAFTNHQGIGDNLRGLISLLQIKEKIKNQKELTIHVDFSKSLISKYLVNQLPNQFLELKETIETKTFYYLFQSLDNDIIDYLLNTQDNTVCIHTNNYPDTNTITEDIKSFIKKSFEFNPYFEEIFKTYYNQIPENYHLYHYRFGDHKFKNDDLDDHTIHKFAESFQQTNKHENCLIISDSLSFKKKIHEIYHNQDVFVFLNQPNHTNSHANGSNLDHENDLYIFIDFFLVTKAKTVCCYSYYPWISNFILWNSYVYDIPVITLSL